MKETIIQQDKNNFVYSPKTGSNLTFRLSEGGDVVVTCQDFDVVISKTEDGEQLIVTGSDVKVNVTDNE